MTTHFSKTNTLVFLRAAIIAAATWFVYAPALHGGWFWDDPSEITTNVALRSRAGLWNIWFTTDSPDYYPLKTTLQWVQWHLWGDNVIGYHITNVCLHLLSALLLWRLLRKLGVRLACLGGLIFAVHPLAVESVAWISELKNVLSLPLLLGAMIAYLNFDEIGPRHFLTAESAEDAEKDNSSSSPRSLRPLRFNAWGWYVLSLTLFFLAMLCKSSVVMFPVILLLYCWWKRGRITRADLLASILFFAVSIILGYVTFWFQQNVAIKGIVVPQGGVWSRFAVAGMAAAFYFSKFAWPAGLLPIYPRWAADPPSLWQFWPWIVIGAVLLGLWRSRSLRSRHILFGMGFFLVNLLPVLGFVPMSFLRISWVADHFAYLPMVGLVGLAAAGISAVYEVPLAPTSSRRTIFWVLVSAIVAALAYEGREYASIFTSEKAAWTYTLERNPQAWLAHNNLGNIMLNEGRVPEAIEQFEQAVRLKPDFAEAHNNLGNTLLQIGRPEEAKREFEEAMKFRPEYGEACNGLGNYYLNAGRPDRALELYKEALRFKPDYTNCRDNMAAALESLGRNEEAILQYERVLREEPGFAIAHYNLGIALAKAGQYPGAVAHYEQALRLDPGFTQAEDNLGNALSAVNRYPEAIAHYERALKLNPDFFAAHLNLGNALLHTSRLSGAIVQYEGALRLKPDFAPGHNSLGIALQAVGRSSEARAQFEEALRLDPGYADARSNLEILEKSGN